MVALPLIALPGIFPRKRGERGWPHRHAISETLAIGENRRRERPSPRLRGEDGGSQM